ncbi:5-formyltetrahydrofolate cyclo-ligase [Sporosarcina sp. NCCP-2222]|uniref:5-formyltetrahydrofolate cyclo-ligase n=1 Tax=Sporosarcina sp. NCCP-2222 TaxID=2935073 RepID=UPI002086DB6B|nr:5-formyltetrahydrofolate cyclo-ligase [Sporosarcina sp. NCCP-2222]GKV54294.1 5-formyltetrahydrofolate cyclo-ligase [Sporosarcina sp. NCCP-2222]
MGKSVARKEVMSLLKEMERTVYEKKSAAICKRFIESDYFARAHTIGVTLSRFPEVDTRPIIEEGWRLGKRIVVPRCLPSTREMDFREITSFDCLETVYMNLKEPIVEQTIAVDRSNIDLQIVPGVVFSNEGYRIGFGGGYYDRYLQEFAGDLVSLAFACQTGKRIPVESHDIPVDTIITEEGIISSVRS